MKLSITAVVGGALGLAAAVATAGVAAQRKHVGKQRATIDPHSAVDFDALPRDREAMVIADDGVALRAEEVGPADAPVTVVFVHGFTLALGSFHFQRQALRAQFGDEIRMVFYDQRSHGRSGRSIPEHCTMEQLGADLLAILHARCPSGRVVLVGHSMGGMTIMALAAQRPQLFHRGGQVAAVLLANTSSSDLRLFSLGLPSAVGRIYSPLLGGVLRGAARNVALVEKGRLLGKDVASAITKRLSFGSAEVSPAVVAYATRMISATPVDVIADFFPNLVAHDGRDGLVAMGDIPVVLIGADRDAMTPMSHTESIAASVPSAQVVVAETAGHLLPLEHPEVLDNALARLVETALDR